MVSKISQISGVENPLLDKDRINADGQVKKDRFRMWLLRYVANDIAVDHPVKICGRYHFKNEIAEVWSGEGKKSYYKNLISCTSVWACPMCRFKILQKRKSEIIELSKAAQADGLFMGFLTLTMQHNKQVNADEFRSDIKDLTEAWRYIMSIPSLKKKIKECRFEYIRALDNRYNLVNGFHPHLHTVVFADTRENVEMIANMIIDYYQARFPEVLRVYQVYEPVYSDPDEKLEQYITKSGMAEEITDPGLNKKSDSSIHPLDTLSLLLKGDYGIYSKEQCIQIYNDYIRATKRVRSITYSKGFKKRYGIVDITDEEIVRDTSDLTEKLMIVSDDILRTLRDKKLMYIILKAMDRYLADKGSLFMSVEIRKELYGIITDQVILDKNNVLRVAGKDFVYDPAMEAYERGSPRKGSKTELQAGRIE